jgi:hypothetical protein
MTNEQLRRMLNTVHWYFTQAPRLTAGECTVQMENRSLLEDERPTMYPDEAKELAEIDAAIVRRQGEIRLVLPGLPDSCMVRWHGGSHWWWTGEIPASLVVPVADHG